MISLTVGAEQALKLSNQANEVKLPQEAFVLHSRVQPHGETTGQGCQLFNTQTLRQFQTSNYAANTKR